MWKQLSMVVALTMTLPGCILVAVEGNGHLVSEERAVSGTVTRVENHSELAVVVREGDQASATVTLDENLQRYVQLSVRGEALRVDVDAPLLWHADGEVEVVLPRLTAAVQAGSGSLTAEDFTHPEDVELQLTGSGSLRYCGPLRSLVVGVDGSGQLTACSTAQEPLESVSAALTGSGSLALDAAARRVDVVSGGSGPVRLKGAAELLTVRASSSGTVDARELTATSAELSTSGSGPVRATVDSGTVRVAISGSGGVELWGDARLAELRDEGSGELVRH